jgi:FkbM family methyltransferase
VKDHGMMIDSAALYLWNLPKLLFSRGPCVIRSNGLEFVLRPRTLDIMIVREIHLDKMYASRLDRPPLTAEVVVDLGANFGAFAVWAYSVFKPKRLILVEPWECNLRLLRMNAHHHGFEDIAEIVPAAIYKKSGAVGFSPSTRAPANSSIEEHSRTQVTALTFHDLLEKHHIKTIDYLKIDIEGGEKFILTEKNRDIFADRIRYAIMEIHRAHMRVEDALHYFDRLGFESHQWDPKEWRVNTRMLEARNPNL